MEGFEMKRLLVSFICLVLMLATLVPNMSAQERRRHRSRFGRKARTAAIIGGGALVGGLVGHGKGAAIGAGAGSLYAFNRKAARRHFKPRTRTAGTVAGGALLGGGIGAAVGHGKGAAIGALVGAGGGALY